MLASAASPNGWRTLTRAQCADVAVPGGVLPVHPAAAPLFTDLATRFHTLVEPLTFPGCWGWADRPIRGSTVPSNHASGTAIDLNAPAHPQGVAVGRTFTRGQVSAVSMILTRYHGLVVWGGIWAPPDTDGMHFELARGVTPAQLYALAAELTPPAPQPLPAPAPPAAPGGWTGIDLTGAGTGLRGEAGATGVRVQALQAFFNRAYPAYSRLVCDGVWGPATSGVLATFAHRSGIASADGRNIGPRLAAALTRAGFAARSAARARALGHVARTTRR